jgi:hypothetical protein
MTVSSVTQIAGHAVHRNESSLWNSAQTTQARWTVIAWAGGMRCLYVVRKKWLPPRSGNRDFFSFVETIKPPVALVAAECVLGQEKSGAINGFILADYI